MNDNFRQQYRRLCKEAEGRPVDLMEDVRGVLHDLGYDVGRPRQTVKVPLHHGTVARKRQLMKTQQNDANGVVSTISTTPALTPEERRRRQRIVQFNANLNAVTREMHEYTARGEQIPRPLWRRYCQLIDSGDAQHGERLSDTRSVSSGSSKGGKRSGTHRGGKLSASARSQGGSSVFKSQEQDELLKEMRSAQMSKVYYLNNAWSSEEREKLQLVFNSTVRKSREPFHEYINNMVVRFRRHCPQRSPREVKEKIRQMIQLKQFKQPGEVEYWNVIMNKGTLDRTSSASRTHLRSLATAQTQYQAQRISKNTG